jgi:uncharacterized paraquat-inducible protein A
MSADNWAVCPRCWKEATDEHDQRRQRVAALYGQIPVADFDAARADLAAKTPKRDDFQTFREDYEFYGVEDWEVTATYKGRCQKCGLALEFSHSEKLNV